MTIRTRLTAWYAAIMFVSLLAMAVLMYHEFAPELRPPPDNATTKIEEADESDLGETLRIVFWCGVPSALLALAGGWWLMRKSLSPVAAITAAAEKIHDGNLNQQLPRSGNGDELDRLTEVFNAMTTRLDGSFQRIREFTLHASHELKTPLTILHGELETALTENNLPAAQRERLASQLDEIQRLTKIVDGLTLLTKADAGLIALQDEPVALDELVRDACADAEILAQPHGIHIAIAQCEAATVRGDQHRLRQVLLNLTDNAVKYNHPGGTVTLALRRRGDTTELTIANTGPGVTPAQQARIFEPFFRGDSTPAHATEGSGLGLTICRWLVTAHRGTLTLSSNPGGLTTATVRLPLAAERAP